MMPVLVVIVALLTLNAIGTFALIAFCRAIYQVGLRIESAISEEGFTSEAALETGFLPFFQRLRDRLLQWRRYPSGRVPKF